MPDPRCYGCGRRVSRQANACPGCGAVQQSLCNCGTAFSVYLEKCPKCGAEGSGKVYRRNWKRPLRVLLVLVLLGAVGYGAYRYFSPGSLSRQQKAYRALVSTFRKGNHGEAKILARSYLREFGEDVRARYVLAYSLLELGAEEEAVAEARKILEKDSTEWAAALLLADVAYAREEHATALQRAEQVLALKPKHEVAHRIAGLVLSQHGYRSTARALEHLGMAFENGDDDVEALLRLAGLCSARDRVLGDMASGDDSARYVAAAKARVEELAARNPKDPESHFYLALFEFSQRRYDEARAHIKNAMDLGANRPYHHLLLGKLEWVRNNRGGAKRVFDRIRQERATAPVLLEIARLYRDGGERGLAEEVLAAAEQKFPGDLGLLFARADDLSEHGDLEGAEALLERAIEAHPGEPRTVLRLCDLLISQPDRRSEAEEILGAETAKASPDASLLFRHAELLLDTDPRDRQRSERILEAERLLARADAGLLDDPRDPAYRQYLAGKLHFTRNEFTDAQAALESSVKADPVSVMPRLLLSRVYGLLGEHGDEAIQLTLAMATAGPVPELLLRRAEARLRLGRTGVTPARRDLAQTLELRPDFEPALALLAQTHLVGKSPDFDAAVAVLERALALPGASPRLHLSLGRVHMLAGNLTAAEHHVRIARERAVDPELRLDSLATLAELQGIEGNDPLSPAARRFWEERLASHPDDVPAMLRYGFVLLAGGDSAGAAKWAGAAMAAEPGNATGHLLAFEASLAGQDPAAPDLGPARAILDGLPDEPGHSAAALYMRGRLALVAGDAALATKHLADACDRAPRDDHAAFYLGLSLLRLGDLEPARAALRTAVRLRPDRLPPRLLLAEVAYRLGREMAAKGALPEAIDEFQSAVALRPGHAASALLLAGSFFDSGLQGSPTDFQSAHRECERLIARLETSGKDREMLSRAYLLMSEICRVREDWDGVARAAEGYFALHPEDGGALMRKGLALVSGNRIEEARETFLRVTRLDPDAWDAAAGLAACRAHQDGIPKAEAGVREWIDAHPGNPAALEFLGWLEFKSGRADEAKESFQKALALDADLASSAVGLARAHWAVGDSEGLETQLEALLERTTRKGTVLFLLGLSEIRERPQSAKGIALLEEAMRSDIRDPATRIWCQVVLLKALFVAGRMEAALRQSRRFARQATDYLEGEAESDLAGLLATGWFHAGQVHHRAGDLEAAEHRYRRAIETRGKYPAALNNLAELILRRGSATREDIEEALGLARRAVELVPEHPLYLDTLGSALLAAEEPGEAAGAFEKSIAALRGAKDRVGSGPEREEITRQTSRTLVRLALARHAEGATDAARATLREAVETWPGVEGTPEHSRAKRRLGR